MHQHCHIMTWGVAVSSMENLVREEHKQDNYEHVQEEKTLDANKN